MTSTEISYDALRKASEAMRGDCGDLNDFPIELVNTLANVYYRFFANLEHMASGGNSRLLEPYIPRSTSMREAFMNYNAFNAQTIAAFETAKTMVEAAQQARSKHTEMYLYLITLILDIFKYNIDEADLKGPIRRGIERKFKKVYEIPNLVELMQKDVVAQSYLSTVYASAEGFTQEEQQTAAWYNKEAEKGNAKGQFNIGLAYSKGEGVAQDYKQAAAWFRKAAEQGHVSAQSMLAKIYALGQGVAQDDQQAIFWWRKAAEQGDAQAQSNLGNRYATGQGVAQDSRQAVFWWRRAAEQGDARSQSNLGTMYSDGEGVAQDHQQAIFWCHKAAEQGHAKAQSNLGLIYAKGEGVPQDHQQAAFWYRKAAEQGNVMAQFALGLMYMKGEGVAEDYIEAHKWLNIAGVGGNSDAIMGREIAEIKMTPEQIVEAQQRASVWMKEKH